MVNELKLTLHNRKNPKPVLPAVFTFFRASINRSSVIFHLTAWTIYLMLPLLLFSSSMVLPSVNFLEIGLHKMVVDFFGIICFYGNYYYLIPYVLRTRRFYAFFLALSGAILLLILINHLYYEAFLKEVLVKNLGSLPDFDTLHRTSLVGIPLPLAVPSLLSFFLQISMSCALALYKDRNEHIEKSQQMVIEKKEAELAALKLQISPHFLFNTLNNMRWLARKKSVETEEAIFRLSEMMRYMIYQVDRGPVPISREIEHINHYIQLQKMRLSANNYIDFKYRVDQPDVLIEPLLFLHFIENAFKYGLHYEKQSTTLISITLNQRYLTFRITNSIPEVPVPSVDSGVGLQNIIRRLELHYPHRHTLTILDDAEIFSVDLTIQL